jgi:hypothetical protein
LARIYKFPNIIITLGIDAKCVHPLPPMPMPYSPATFELGTKLVHLVSAVLEDVVSKVMTNAHRIIDIDTTYPIYSGIIISSFLSPILQEYQLEMS